jgi:hypothetical protein
MKQTFFLGARTVALITSATLISGCATAPAQSWLWQHPEYAKSERMGRVVAVLPPDVELSEGTQSKRNKSREAEIGKQLYTAVTNALAKRGFTPKADLLERSGGNDSEFKLQYKQLTAEFDQASRTHNLINTESILARKERISVGQTAKGITAASGADMLVLVRCRGWEDTDRPSDAAMAASFVPTVALALATGLIWVPDQRLPSRTSLTIEVGLIDVTSGDLVWLRSSIFSTVDMGEKDLHTALDSLPSATVSKP